MTDLLRELYEARINTGTLDEDPHQRDVLDQLSALRHRLLKSSGSFLRLFRRSGAKGARGLYLWGGVGRGKSMLMDLLVESIDKPSLKSGIRRVHFQDFMQEVHARVHAHTLAGAAAPVQVTVEELVKDLSLLAFDEMQVSGIADAMLLNRLFRAMLNHGVTIVATSNLPPSELYDDVLQRDAFLPFVRLVSENFDVIEIGGGQDHRRRAADCLERWFWPNDRRSQIAMDALWSQQSPQGNAVMTLRTQGRAIDYDSDGARAVRASFESLCEEPHSAADYLALANAIDLLLIDNVPELGVPNRDAARRFMMLLDALYERKVAIAASAMRPIESLLVNPSILSEFPRTVSRVIALRRLTLPK